MFPDNNSLVEFGASFAEVEQRGDDLSSVEVTRQIDCENVLLLMNIADFCEEWWNDHPLTLEVVGLPHSGALRHRARRTQWPKERGLLWRMPREKGPLVDEVRIDPREHEHRLALRNMLHSLAPDDKSELIRSLNSIKQQLNNVLESQSTCPPASRLDGEIVEALRYSIGYVNLAMSRTCEDLLKGAKAVDPIIPVVVQK
jgi:hypothetical protein